NGVTIIGNGCLEGLVSTHASQVYASNLINFISHFWDAKQGGFQLNLQDEILKGCLLTKDGAVIHPQFQ
ncbi:hypothetical protein RZS08_61700, partial [Arthrospira platensis SPKY1]|nr:hypothetical protein [Arthrospira platensis SPKY1]